MHLHIQIFDTECVSFFVCVENTSSLNSRVCLSACVFVFFASATLKSQPEPGEEEPRLRDMR